MLWKHILKYKMIYFNKDTSIDPMFETKSKLQKRNIVGKPEIFRKV